MTIPHLLQAVLAEIGRRLPELRDTGTHPSPLDATELQRLALALPAVRLVHLGADQVEPVESGEIDAELRLAAFTVTGEAPGLHREAAAAAIVEALLTLIPGQRWGETTAHPAREATAANLTTEGVAHLGLALWEVAWRQKVRLGQAILSGDGTLPTELYLGFAPEIGRAHEPRYVRIDSDVQLP
jgi:hypothetical protein